MHCQLEKWSGKYIQVDLLFKKRRQLRPRKLPSYKLIISPSQVTDQNHIQQTYRQARFLPTYRTGISLTGDLGLLTTYKLCVFLVKYNILFGYHKTFDMAETFAVRDVFGITRIHHRYTAVPRSYKNN